MGISPASLEIKPSAHLVDPTSFRAGGPVPQCFRRSLAKKGRGWEAGRKQKAHGLLGSSSRGRLACPPGASLLPRDLQEGRRGSQGKTILGKTHGPEPAQEQFLAGRREELRSSYGAGGGG